MIYDIIYIWLLLVCLVLKNCRHRVADWRLVTNRARPPLDPPGGRHASQGGALMVTCGPPLGETVARSGQPPPRWAKKSRVHRGFCQMLVRYVL